jgi:hypothetical protein
MTPYTLIQPMDIDVDRQRKVIDDEKQQRPLMAAMWFRALLTVMPSFARAFFDLFGTPASAPSLSRRTSPTSISDLFAARANSCRVCVRGRNAVTVAQGKNAKALVRKMNGPDRFVLSRSQENDGAAHGATAPLSVSVVVVRLDRGWPEIARYRWPYQRFLLVRNAGWTKLSTRHTRARVCSMDQRFSATV